MDLLICFESATCSMNYHYCCCKSLHPVFALNYWLQVEIWQILCKQYAFHYDPVYAGHFLAFIDVNFVQVFACSYTGDTLHVTFQSLSSPYVIGQTIIFLPCDFYLLSFFFSSPNQQSEVGCLPYFHTWCGLSANLECMSEMCCTRLAENTGCKKSPFWRHRTTLSGYIFAAEACMHNRKKTC